MTLEDIIKDSISRIRRAYGQGYPSNQAERRSLLNWVYTDVCKRNVDADEVERVVVGIIGG